VASRLTPSPSRSMSLSPTTSSDPAGAWSARSASQCHGWARSFRTDEASHTVRPRRTGGLTGGTRCPSLSCRSDQLGQVGGDQLMANVEMHTSEQTPRRAASFTRMKWNPRCIFKLGAIALATVIGTGIWLSVAPAATSAAPANLIQNGTFGTVATPTNTYEAVDAGNSTTISDWTVVTPPIYEGTGSVDVVSKHYWNAEQGKYSIDLGGSTGVPGGIYQDVATTPGVEYSLSFWSAVNGDEKPGIKHKMDVTVNGSELDTVKAVSAGRPLDWVENTATFFASSATSEIEFADATPTDTVQGPTVDNVSLTVVPDDISASPVSPPIPPQTAGVSFSDIPVATFTDTYPAAPISDFSATITWGDGGSSAGTISQSGSTYTVSGSYSYAASGTYTVGVGINSISGSTASTSEPVSVGNNVANCSGSGCSGTANGPDETVGISSSSTSGTIVTTIGPADTAPDCGDPYRHAPDVVTFDTEGVTSDITFTVTFENASAAGEWYVPFEVCYQSDIPFTDYFGNTDVTTGLLPTCGSSPVAPCVESITESPDPQGNPSDAGNVVEVILVPPGDPPKFH
jgi:choice-of-anchor C domain-containing protein